MKTFAFIRTKNIILLSFPSWWNLRRCKMFEPEPDRIDGVVVVGGGVDDVEAGRRCVAESKQEDIADHQVDTVDLAAGP